MANEIALLHVVFVIYAVSEEEGKSTHKAKLKMRLSTSTNSCDFVYHDNRKNPLSMYLSMAAVGNNSDLLLPW